MVQAVGLIDASPQGRLTGSSLRLAHPYGDGRLNATDVPVLPRVVLGSTPGILACDDAPGANDDGRANISDVLPPLPYLFQRVPRLQEPFRCSIDWTDDDLTCRESSPVCPVER